MVLGKHFNKTQVTSGGAITTRFWDKSDHPILTSALTLGNKLNKQLFHPDSFQGPIVSFQYSSRRANSHWGTLLTLLGLRGAEGQRLHRVGEGSVTTCPFSSLSSVNSVSMIVELWVWTVDLQPRTAYGRVTEQLSKNSTGGLGRGLHMDTAMLWHTVDVDSS